ncbi:hypothetical protein EDD16DRAFT_1727699 [Pisolithus croceorrhizus]|nr:hypothetical protein EDD16DRAFT_1727699 [Pisolithus croceorrhizus]
MTALTSNTEDTTAEFGDLFARVELGEVWAPDGFGGDIPAESWFSDKVQEQYFLPAPSAVEIVGKTSVAETDFDANFVNWHSGYLSALLGDVEGGLTVGLALYGVAVRQYLFYIPTFPNDKYLLRSAVLLVVYVVPFVAFFYSRSFITCRWQTTDLSTAFGTSFPVSFFVQWFETCLTLLFAFSMPHNSIYAHRVWIIGHQNKLLTGAVVVAALVQLALFGVARHADNITTLFDSPRGHTGQYNPVNYLGSAVCDAIITASVFYYLRTSRTGLFRIYNGHVSIMTLVRKDNHIQKLNMVFVLITFLNTLAIAILYHQDNMVGKYLTTAPGTMKSKTYSNSLLAVLNARKSIRDQQQTQASPLDVPTLPILR